MPRRRYKQKTIKSILDVVDKTTGKVNFFINNNVALMLGFIIAACIVLTIAGYLAYRGAQKTAFPNHYRSQNEDDPSIHLSVRIERVSVDDTGTEALDLTVDLDRYNPGIVEAKGKSYCIEEVYLATAENARLIQLSGPFALVGLSPLTMPMKIFDIEGLCTLEIENPNVTGGDIAMNLLRYGANGEVSPGSFVNEWVYPLKIDNSLYTIDLTRYPYDTREDILLFWVNIRTADGELISVAPTVSLTISPISRESSVIIATETNDLPEGISEATSVQIKLKRPINIRFLSAVLLLSLAGFIISIPFVRDNGTAIEISLGILLGLWGIQEVLVPSDIKGITFIQSAVIYLYFLLALISILRFFAIPLYRRLRTQIQGLNQSTPK